MSARLWKAPQASLTMSVAPGTCLGARSTFMLKSPQGSPQVQTCAWHSRDKPEQANAWGAHIQKQQLEHSAPSTFAHGMNSTFSQSPSPRLHRSARRSACRRRPPASRAAPARTAAGLRRPCRTVIHTSVIPTHPCKCSFAPNAQMLCMQHAPALADGSIMPDAEVEATTG